jgi:hypothetical protein
MDMLEPDASGIAFGIFKMLLTGEGYKDIDRYELNEHWR